MLGALRHRHFALLWAGQSLSAVGNRMFPVILALVVLDRHSGAAALGVVLAVQSVALVVGTLLAAAVTDRLPRRAIMLWTDLARALAVAALAFTPDTALVGLVIVIAVAEGLFQPAYAAVIPRTLPAGCLQAGNSLTSFSQYTALVIGPSLAGAVIATAGTTAALWVDVGTFAMSLATLAFVRESQAEAATKPPPWSLRQTALDLGEGFQAVRRRPWLGASMVASMLVMSITVAPMMLIAPLATDSPQAYGAAFTALGVGSILGALLAARLRTRRPGATAVIGIVLVAGAPLSLAALPLPGVLLLWGTAGAGITIFEVLWTTAVQRDVPDEVLGRVMALDWLGSESLTPIGYLLAGLAVARFGTDLLLLVGACIAALAAPLPLFVRGGCTFSSPACGPTAGGATSRPPG
ncbi:MFS transporter [Actinomadura rugatobispora]|uniref:MFS transporter n=1 Tax=Actinomadura rugatobispora TaxID=1994 RepID=A0ABW1A7M0_9ACTN